MRLSAAEIAESLICAKVPAGEADCNDVLMGRRDKERIRLILQLHRRGFGARAIAEKLGNCKSATEIEDEGGQSVHLLPHLDDGNLGLTAFRRQQQQFQRWERYVAKVIELYGKQG